MKINAFSVKHPDGFLLSVDALEAEPGKICSVIGANGCGKSTFLRALAGAVKTADGTRPVARELTVSYLPQKPFAFRRSVLSNVMLAEHDTERARMLLGMLGIDSLSDRKAHRLSGGETARMALARCLMSECSLLLLDEPTAAMDVEATVLAEKAIVTVCRELGCSVFLVTHSIAQAERISDTALFFRNGRIAESGDTKQMLRSPKHAETGKFLEFSGY